MSAFYCRGVSVSSVSRSSRPDPGGRVGVGRLANAASEPGRDRLPAVPAGPPGECGLGTGEDRARSDELAAAPRPRPPVFVGNGAAQRGSERSR